MLFCLCFCCVYNPSTTAHFTYSPGICNRFYWKYNFSFLVCNKRKQNHKTHTCRITTIILRSRWKEYEKPAKKSAKQNEQKNERKFLFLWEMFGISTWFVSTCSSTLLKILFGRCFFLFIYPSLPHWLARSAFAEQQSNFLTNFVVAVKYFMEVKEKHKVERWKVWRTSNLEYTLYVYWYGYMASGIQELTWCRQRRQCQCRRKREKKIINSNINIAVITLVCARTVCDARRWYTWHCKCVYKTNHRRWLCTTVFFFRILTFTTCDYIVLHILEHSKIIFFSSSVQHSPYGVLSSRSHLCDNRRWRRKKRKKCHWNVKRRT